MIKKLLILIVILLAVSQTAMAKKVRAPKNKFGIAKTTLASASFTITSENVAFTAQKPLVGNIIFYERIFFGVFSLGFQYGPKLERTVQASSTTSSVVVFEKGSYRSIDLKAFLSDHKLGGLKFYAVASQGNLNLESSIETRSTSGVVTTETADSKVPLVYTGIGMDLFKTYTKVGFRIEAGQVEGQHSEISSSRQADYNYSGLYYNMGFYLLF